MLRGNTVSLRKSFVVVDDHPLYRHGVVALVEQELHLTLAGEAGTIPEAMELIRRQKPDLAIIDISLQEKNGLELVKMVKTECPSIAIVVLSMHEEILYGDRAINAGALGYVMKHEAPAILLQRIQAVLEGKVAVSDALRERMLATLVGGRHDKDPIERLSDRELEVFRLIGRGYGAAEIADMLHLSVKTVNAYRDHIKEKLNIGSASELRKMAVEWTTTADKI
ncbi:MAG: response regulator transcription factor [Termitinemataceae bacterium]